MNFRALTAIGFLAASFSLASHAATTPAADAVGEKFFDRAAEYRPAPEGIAQLCASSIERAAKFLFSDAGMDNSIRDENGNKLPPYIYHAVIDDDNRFTYRVSYPAYHHAYLIEAFLNYYNYSGSEEALRRARQLADWTIAHSSLTDSKWPLLPWSTFTEGKPSGFMDKDTLQPDKVGYMGLAYVRLHQVTGESRYLAAAKGIADTLEQRQSKDGSWPFRVNPQTGEVYEPYTPGIFMDVAFLEKMFTVTGNYDYKNAQIAGWMWMLRNPVRNNNWSGFYEDIAKGKESHVYYAPAQTIRLLLRYRTPANEASYMTHARALFDYVMDGLAFDDRDMGLLLREQTGYLAATPSSTLSWSMMAAEMFLATSEEKYRYVVLEAMRSVTKFGLKPDGRTNNTMLGPRIYGNKGSWYSLTSPVVRYIYQDMGCLPELAPNDENHLLRTSTEIRRIAYSDRGIAYQSMPDSIELIKLKAAPISVSVKDWKYNERSHVLLIRHHDPDIQVKL